MSVSHVPVQWNRNKWLYDAALLAAVVAYLSIFLALGAGGEASRPLDGAVLRMRAFGTCAFLMLTLILCIGPLARLDRRFLPLLYNRRHFGVMTAVVAAIHASHVLGWYFAFSPTPPYQALLASNTAYGQLLGFPFEAFGIFALLVLAVLAATSHDFWLSFLTPPVWKALHLSIYPAYAAVVAHVALGRMQDADNPAFPMVAALGGLAVAGLHLAARGRGIPAAAEDAEWMAAGDAADISDMRAITVEVAPGERAAIFRHGRMLSALSNACAHQNGPLGEGRIVDGCVTCPWHGFQYRPVDGCAPEPFTEKLATYDLRIEGTTVMIRRQANPPGTWTAPAALPGSIA